jgi:hypothetical protein
VSTASTTTTMVDTPARGWASARGRKVGEILQSHRGYD